jgi:polyhydroxyalkanoate synthesis regulator phasin
MEVDLLLQQQYSKKLEEQIEIMEQMLELKDKTININNEHIKELKNQIDELIVLLNRAIEVASKNI